MDIVRNPDGTLTVPVDPPRAASADDVDGAAEVDPTAPAAPTTAILHPGEGGYDEALAEWDLQQNPDRGPVVSTASGREEAMHVVHEVAAEDVPVTEAVAHLDDPDASAEALRHVLVGGVPSVKGFASEVAEAEGDDEPIPPHQVTKAIGEVLAELDG